MTQRLFTVNEFARLSRTTDDTLRHYDKIDLLSPMARGENNYRYYSKEQLSLINLIQILRQSGMLLAEIKDLKEYRTPEMADELLSRQIKQINAKISNGLSAQKLLLTLQRVIHSALNVDEDNISIQFKEAEAIIIGQKNDYDHGGDDYGALYDFYRMMGAQQQDLDSSYPVWGIFNQERIKRGDWKYPDRYYFFNPDGSDQRPAATYAIGYTRGNYGQTDELYRRIMAYIDQHGFEVCGDAYEEYPLNEVSMVDENNYLIRVMVMVRKVGKSEGKGTEQTS